MEEYTGSEEFSYYMERLEYFFTSNSIEKPPENTERRKGIPLSVIEGKVYGIDRDLLAPNKLTDKSYSEMVKFLQKSLSTKTAQDCPAV